MKRKTRLPVFRAFLLALALLGSLISFTTAQPAAPAPDWLPKTAQVVFSSQWEDGALSDASFKLKAKMTQEDFNAVVKELKLTPHTEDRKYTDETTWLSWAPASDERWDPSPKLDTTFVLQDGRWWQLAKYENGFLYYFSISH